MKNKIIILLILIVPLAVFILLEQFTKDDTANAIPSDVVGVSKLIKFYSPMCSECKTVGKNVENVMPDYEGVVVLEEINASKTDKMTKSLVSKYKITVVPTLVFIDKQGKVQNTVEGMIEEQDIRNNLEKIK